MYIRFFVRVCNSDTFLLWFCNYLAQLVISISLAEAEQNTKHAEKRSTVLCIPPHYRANNKLLFKLLRSVKMNSAYLRILAIIAWAAMGWLMCSPESSEKASTSPNAIFSCQEPRKIACLAQSSHRYASPAYVFHSRTCRPCQTTNQMITPSLITLPWVTGNMSQYIVLRRCTE